MMNSQWRPTGDLHAPSNWWKPAFNVRPPPVIFKAENKEHWCETCDKEFPTFYLLEKHKGQHQKCNIDGCQFIAHPKVITRHIQMQHSSGLYKKIAKLDNPEEIQKWREERKKKYPTKSTIEKKAAEIKEKVERGEKIGLKHDRRNSDNKTGNVFKRRNEYNNQNRLDFKRKKTYANQNYGVSVAKPKPSTQRVHMLPPIEMKRKLQPFSGIQNIISENCVEDNDNSLAALDLIEDDDFETTEGGINEQNFIKPKVCGALSSLICDYGSSEDENIDKFNTNKCGTNQIEICDAIKVTNCVEKDLTQDTYKSGSEPLAQNNMNKDTDNRSDDDSGPEEIKTTKPSQNILEENVVKKRFEHHSKKFSQQRLERSHLFRRPKVKLPSTLLTKLLRREMQKERNIILQCIRHVIKNNYFENNKIV